MQTVYQLLPSRSPETQHILDNVISNGRDALPCSSAGAFLKPSEEGDKCPSPSWAGDMKG